MSEKDKKLSKALVDYTAPEFIEVLSGDKSMIFDEEKFCNVYYKDYGFKKCGRHFGIDLEMILKIESNHF